MASSSTADLSFTGLSFEPNAKWVHSLQQPPSKALVDAFLAVPRSCFVPVAHRSKAYVDSPLEVPEFSTRLSAPHMYPMMLDPMAIERGMVCLDVGCGTGYSATLMAFLAGPTGLVIAWDTIPSSTKAAQSIQALLQSLVPPSVGRPLSQCLSPITFQTHNVFAPIPPWAKHRFHRIFVGANANAPSYMSFCEFLIPGGQMLVPCDGELVIFTLSADRTELSKRVLGNVRFGELVAHSGSSASLPSPFPTVQAFTVSNHLHPMQRSSSESRWNCDACSQVSTVRWRCDPCDFDLCCNCLDRYKISPTDAAEAERKAREQKQAAAAALRKDEEEKKAAIAAAALRKAEDQKHLAAETEHKRALAEADVERQAQLHRQETERLRAEMEKQRQELALTELTLRKQLEEARLQAETAERLKLQKEAAQLKTQQAQADEGKRLLELERRQRAAEADQLKVLADKLHLEEEAQLQAKTARLKLEAKMTHQRAQEAEPRHLISRDQRIVSVLTVNNISVEAQNKLFEVEGLDFDTLSVVELDTLIRCGVPSLKAKVLLGQLQSLVSSSLGSQATSLSSQQVVVIRHSELTYDPHRPLARGSYGCVYDAVFKGQRVAVKTLINQAGLAEFIKESEVMSSFRAPFLVRLIGITLEPQTMVMEMMEGGSLFDLLHRKKTESVDWNLQWRLLHQTALGIQYLHSQSVAHRDLKSGNILLSKDFHQVKLADFGLSRRCDADGLAGTLTSLAGTLHYMAPELLSSKSQQSSLSADIYAFAIIMWEVVFRAIPWQSVKDHATFKRQVLDCRMRPVIDESVELPIEFIEIMFQCWAHESHRRPNIGWVIFSLESCRTISPGMNPYRSTSSSSASIVIPGGKPPGASAGQHQQRDSPSPADRGTRALLMPVFQEHNILQETQYKLFSQGLDLATLQYLTVEDLEQAGVPRLVARGLFLDLQRLLNISPSIAGSSPYVPPVTHSEIIHQMEMVQQKDNPVLGEYESFSNPP